MTIRALLQELADVRRKLAPYGIRDESKYAELLVEKALKGTRHVSGLHKGSDLVAPNYGRVEVRSRTLPLDGRSEARINLPESKRGEFDWFAGVIFNSDLTVKAAFLLPHDSAWVCAATNKRSDVTLKEAEKEAGFEWLPRLIEAELEMTGRDDG